MSTFFKVLILMMFVSSSLLFAEGVPSGEDKNVVSIPYKISGGNIVFPKMIFNKDLDKVEKGSQKICNVLKTAVTVASVSKEDPRAGTGPLLVLESLLDNMSFDHCKNLARILEIPVKNKNPFVVKLLVSNINFCPRTENGRDCSVPIE